MRKTFASVCLLLASISVFAAIPLDGMNNKAKELSVKLGHNGQMVSLSTFMELSDADYEILTGEKLGLFGKMHFHSEQRKFKKLFDADGNIDEEKIYKDLDQSKGFNLAGFMMGFTLSLVGVLAMYLSKDGRKANRTKWAWIGTAFWVAFLIVIIAVA